MPLTQSVKFTSTLQVGNTVQIPNLVRWQFKLESNQVLKIGVCFVDKRKGWQSFYSKMRKDGRFTIPKLILIFFEEEMTSLAGQRVEVTITPA